MVGKGAPADFVQNLEELAKTHHAEMSLDHIRAYYFGQRFIVEMEVVLPSAMTVRESHDIAMILQHKVCIGVLSVMCSQLCRPPPCHFAARDLHTFSFQPFIQFI